MNTRSTLFPRSSGTGVEAGLPVPHASPGGLESLTPVEASALDRCEQVIRKGLKTFVEVGQALMEIRDGRLYREHFKTWEEYCRGTWGFTARYAQYQIEGSKVVKELKVGAALLPERIKDSRAARIPEPATESQARPLTRLPVEARLPAWREAVTASNGKPTARHVEEVVRAREITSTGRAGPEVAAPARADSRVGKILAATALAIERVEILRKLVDLTDTPCQVALQRAFKELTYVEVKFKRKSNDLLAKASGWIEVKPKRNLRGTYGPAQGGKAKAPQTPGRRVATTPLRALRPARRKPRLSAAARARIGACARARWAKIKRGNSPAQTNHVLARALGDSMVKAAAGKGL
jgi:hypothetical protein